MHISKLNYNFATMSGSFKSKILWYARRRNLPFWCILLGDCATILFSGILASYFVKHAPFLVSHFWSLVLQLLCMLPLYAIGMRMFHTYKGLLRYSTMHDCYQVGKALLLGAALVCTAIVLLGLFDLFTWDVLVLMLLIAFVGQVAVRILIRVLYDSISFGSKQKNALIYGAMDGGVSIAHTIRSMHTTEYSVVGFISVRGEKKGSYIMGVRVYDDSTDTKSLIERLDIKTFFVSPLQMDYFRTRKGLINYLLEHDIKIMVINQAMEWDPSKQTDKLPMLKEVEIEDLLPRDKIEINMENIGKMLRGKRILITGAAGSIGFEMVKQITKFAPAELTLIDQAETPMHDVRLYMAHHCPDILCETIVGSINNATHMESIFKSRRPEYVFHAAAYKHVPMMEDNPAMAVQNNIYGTRVIADLAVKYGTKKFVMISTDKAVNPTNVMGCSKRICEIYCQSLNAYLQEHAEKEGSKATCTQFITTRFGNVLGSNGSVIPLFKKQIAEGGPVTVTHPDIIRFFMLISEACQLVLEAGTMGNGGEIFVFDMGNPVRIADLAQKLIHLSGAKSIEIKYTGLRPGEKLYEEVLSDTEMTKPTIHPKIRIASVRDSDYEKAVKDEEELYQLSMQYDNMAIVRKMKEIVPEYKSQNSKYETLDNKENSKMGGV